MNNYIRLSEQNTDSIWKSHLTEILFHKATFLDSVIHQNNTIKFLRLVKVKTKTFKGFLPQKKKMYFMYELKMVIYFYQFIFRWQSYYS